MSGRIAWTTTLSGISNQTIDDSSRVALDPVGEAVLVGFRRFPSAPERTQTAFVARLGSDGTELWEREIPAMVPFMNPVSVVLTPAGDIVTLIAMTGGGKRNGLLLRLSADGTILWSRQIATAEEQAVATGLALAPNGDLVAVATQALGTGPSTGLVRRFDPSGTARWTAEVSIGLRSQLLDVTVDPAGRSHVVGSTRPTLSPTDLAEVLYGVVEDDGTVAQKYKVGRPGTHFIAWEIVTSAANHVFIAGTDRVDARVPAVRGYAARLQPSGDVEWFTPMQAPDWSFNGGITLTPNGRVVQGGTEIHQGALRSVVRVLDARTGQELTRRGPYHAESHEEDVHDIVVRGASEVTAVGGRTLPDGTWRPYAAREVLTH